MYPCLHVPHLCICRETSTCCSNSVRTPLKVLSNAVLFYIAHEHNMPDIRQNCPLPVTYNEAAQAEARKKAEEEAVKVLKEAEEKKDIDVILAVMAQHRDSTEVQVNGCGALMNVATRNAATRRTIAEKGGIEAVFHAMTQHSHHEGVQEWGCYVMYYMVDLESARPAIRKGKAVMDAARNNFPNNSDIKLYLNIVYGKI